VEAVVALPVFVVVFVSLVYVRDGYIARQAANLRSRECAWLYSASGCESVPPGCEGLVSIERKSVPVGDALKGALGNAAQGAAEAVVIDNSGFSGVLAVVLREFLTPLLGRLFEENALAQGRARLSAPALYGGDDFWVRGRVGLACNLVVPRTPGDVAAQVFGEIF
jgi:hypothetical protein